MIVRVVEDIGTLNQDDILFSKKKKGRLWFCLKTRPTFIDLSYHSDLKQKYADVSLIGIRCIPQSVIEQNKNYFSYEI